MLVCSAMPRPKKPRFVDGVQLPDNLYRDARKRANYWRYRRADGTSKVFHATLKEAIKAGNEANALRDTAITISSKIPPRDSIIIHVKRYIQWREDYDPKLQGKASWKNRINAMLTFANHFEQTKISHLTLDILRPWWESLSYHAQHARRSEFNRLFNYLAGQGLTPRLDFNPFTTADDRPRLMEKGKPEVKRARLPLDKYWQIYRRAGELGYEGLQIAMGISLLTTMRIGDVCDLRFDQHVTERSLQKTINKSEAQREAISVAHLEFDFSVHQLLHRLVNQARELSLKNKRCPYLVSHEPKQRRKGKTKNHICQVTPRRLDAMFAEARAGLFPAPSDKYSPPTFHEIRALASHRFEVSGFSRSDVMGLMAHTHERVTAVYQTGHGTKYQPIDIALSSDAIEGEFLFI